jgi:hypothetical protein
MDDNLELFLLQPCQDYYYQATTGVQPVQIC